MNGVDSTQKDVVLCCMPWLVSRRPSLPMGILKAICTEEDVSSTVIYGNFDMASRIGMRTAGKLASERSLFGLSEHVFACSLFGRQALHSDQFINRMAESSEISNLLPRQFWFALRDEIVPQFISDMVQRILNAKPSIVGFSSTFNQVMSSLAIAAKLRERDPKIKILLGGACFHDPMGQEYHRVCSEFIDHVFLGEGDDSFRQLLRCWKQGQSFDGLPGITYLVDGEVCYNPTQPVENLDSIPIPDYDDYYDEGQRLALERRMRFHVEALPYESSRGCWWGQKNHCTFCGLTDDALNFRGKSPQRVMQEISALSTRYQETNLLAVDLIVSWPGMTPVLDELAHQDVDLALFYEVKASMKKNQFELLRNAGVSRIQPGIESFSTEALRHMDKGTSFIINVQFLKWAREYEIMPVYNLLFGFPGEKAEWYDGVLDYYDLLHHLQPPGCLPHLIEIHRFSPLFDKSEEFGMNTLKPRSDFAYCFPEGVIDLNKCSYYFYEEGGNANEWDEFSDYMNRTRSAVANWIDAYSLGKKPPSLTYRIGKGFIYIRDFRARPRREYKMVEEYMDVFLLCDRITPRKRLHKTLSHKYTAEEINQAIEGLTKRGLLISEGNKLLTLAVADSPRPTESLEAIALTQSSMTQQSQLQSS